VVVSGTVTLLVSSPAIRLDPTGEPSPVPVFAPLEVFVVVELEVVFNPEPKPLHDEANGKPPKLQEPPNGPNGPL
jgi:hypothetical protein